VRNNFIPTSFNLSYSVVEGFDQPKGKFANTLGNVAIVDCRSIGIKFKQQLMTIIQDIEERSDAAAMIINQILPNIKEFVNGNTRDIDVCKYGLTIEGLLTKPASYYSESDSDKMEASVVKKGIEIIERIGLDTNVTISAPLIGQVEQIGLLRIFLASSMSTVVFFLAILSIQLIYSLMIADVDEKTYQYGMLRALGFHKKGLVSLISLQSISFSIPGICGGLIVASFLNFITRFFVFQYSRNSTDYDLSSGSIWLGLGMGLVMPLLANIDPIQRALSKNLRVSLDLYHRTINEMTVKIKKLENMGMSVN
jgi:ABC-type antimicrobial peptide transport system permease subunit